MEIQTPDELKYQFQPAPNGVFNFAVRAPNDAHIALTKGPEESDPMYEVFLGGWSNSKSVIRKNRTKPDVAEVETPDILSAGEFRRFWIKWQNGSISAGRGDDPEPFLAFTDNEIVPIGYVGVCTGWGATGTWKIEVPPQPSAPSAPSGGNFWWQKTSNGQVLDNAVQGGVDLGSGEVLYIARAEHEGALLPGKCVPSHGVTYVPWGGGEHGKPEYEILCGCQGEWVAASEGHIPEGALEAGKTEDGEVLYIGRVNDGERFGLGKVQASHKVCYIPYGGQELAYPDYEVYVLP
ncbi:UNVERIFIED_CONTAM: hypothetical protein PYX00_000797 [Menopon gallinae]|uniref:Farnesoic acid O-methyl transferase domain-containing protein n=1 Tax=Menopon gallinae TaxID=328185 RepID=A0AAW2IBQ3_9NEOP